MWTRKKWQAISTMVKLSRWCFVLQVKFRNLRSSPCREPQLYNTYRKWFKKASARATSFCFCTLPMALQWMTWNLKTIVSLFLAFPLHFLNLNLLSLYMRQALLSSFTSANSLSVYGTITSFSQLIALQVTPTPAVEVKPENESEPTFQVFVKTVAGKSITVDVRPSTQIHTIAKLAGEKSSTYSVIWFYRGGDYSFCTRWGLCLLETVLFRTTVKSEQYCGR